MGLDDILQTRGVQMLLANVVKQAAPELVTQIEEFAKLVKDLRDRQIRCEEMLTKLTGENHGFVAPADGIAAPVAGIGSADHET